MTMVVHSEPGSRYQGDGLHPGADAAAADAAAVGALCRRRPVFEALPASASGLKFGPWVAALLWALRWGQGPGVEADCARVR